MAVKQTHLLVAGIFLMCGIACKQQGNEKNLPALPKASVLHSFSIDSSLLDHSAYYPVTYRIYTHKINPEALLAFARTLIGVPYKYASATPDSGFDCSGFITYVFNHFNIMVPRASVSFTNMEKEVPLADAGPGDLILFTGTDTSIHTVGHMGIIERNETGQLYFIHASSGTANSVTTSLLDAYYQSRFVKIIRIF